MDGPPAGLTRRPQISELIRSESCQSGPAPARRLSCLALPSPQRRPSPTHPRRPRRRRLFHLSPWSPPLFRRDMRHVRNAEGFVAVHRSVNDIDGIAPQYQIDERCPGTLPTLDLVLAHGVDEVVLLGRTELCEFAAAVERLARIVDGAQRSAIEIGVGRANVKNARFEQGFLRRNGKLLIDEISDTCRTRAGDERLAQC